MSQFDTVWKALRTALLTDTTLKGMLGAADAIYFDSPRADLPFPCITIDIQSLNPQNRNGSFTGVWRPSLQFNLFGIDRFVLDRINARLVDAWDIPRNRTQPIDATGYRITKLQQTSAFHVGRIRLTQSQTDLRHFAAEWSLRVVQN